LEISSNVEVIVVSGNAFECFDKTERKRVELNGEKIKKLREISEAF
jgi:hypothetical protein